MPEILASEFIIFSLIFLRIISALLAAPIFSNSAIPPLAKVFIAFVISYILFGSIETGTVSVEFNVVWLVVNGFKEIITGLVIGFTMNIIFYSIDFAGMIIGFEIGLSMATIFNPVDETSSNVLGQLIYYLALMVFFIINGHHYVIQALASSIIVIPLGTYAVNGSVAELIIQYSGAIFVIAVKIAAPIIVSFFLMQIAEGIISRVIPQMQVFFVTYPIKLAVGFMIMTLLLPLYVSVIKNLLYDFENKLFTLVKAIGS